MPYLLHSYAHAWRKRRRRQVCRDGLSICSHRRSAKLDWKGLIVQEAAKVEYLIQFFFPSPFLPCHKICNFTSNWIISHYDRFEECKLSIYDVDDKSKNVSALSLI